MSKTIENQLKDLEKKEKQLKKETKELAKLRQQLETEKIQEKINQQKQKFSPYVKQFEDLGFHFLYKQDKITIKPLNFESDKYLEFIYLKPSEATTDVLNKLLQTIRLGRLIEKNTPFKLFDIYNKMEFKTIDSGYQYLLMIKPINNHYTVTIIKESLDDKYSYRYKINQNLSMVIESTGYDSFNISWTYDIQANKENLIQKINKAMDILTKS